MRRRIHVWAFLAACAPAVLLAQAASDHLTLDLYLEMQTVADPHLSPDAAQTVMPIAAAAWNAES